MLTHSLTLNLIGRGCLNWKHNQRIKPKQNKTKKNEEKEKNNIKNISLI